MPQPKKSLLTPNTKTNIENKEDVDSKIKPDSNKSKEFQASIS